MSAEIRVGPAQVEVTSEPVGVMIAPGIASTAALAIIDRECGAGGMLHWIVPQAPTTRGEHSPALAADTGIPWLVHALEQRGAKRESMRAALVGCASLQGGGSLDLGERNRAAARRLLLDSGVTLELEAVGGSALRELRLHLISGRFEIEPKEEAKK